MEAIEQPHSFSIGLDSHVFLPVKPHTQTLDLNSCGCLGQGRFVPCQQVSSCLRQCDWPWRSRLLSFLPHQLSHPPWRGLYDLMERTARHFWPPLCPHCTSDLLHTLLTCILLKNIWSPQRVNRTSIFNTEALLRNIKSQNQYLMERLFILI